MDRSRLWGKWDGNHVRICGAQIWNVLLDIKEIMLTGKIFIWVKQLIGSWSKDVQIVLQLLVW